MRFRALSDLLFEGEGQALFLHVAGGGQNGDHAQGFLARNIHFMIDIPRNIQEVARADIEAFPVADVVAVSGSVVEDVIRFGVDILVRAAAGTDFRDVDLDVLIDDGAPGIGLVVRGATPGVMSLVLIT